MTTAFFTDHYELTMVDAARRSGLAERNSVFEVFARNLPTNRRYGVVAGTSRLLESISKFRFSGEQLEFLKHRKVVSSETLDWLASFKFGGNIRGYAEGELFFPGSPILCVEGEFQEVVILETLILSILNYDCAVASAASRMSLAAQGTPLIEMGSRRIGEHSAIAAARAAFISGFQASSNLEAGLRFGIPTMGTSAHSFTLLHDSEEDAFEAQIKAMGIGTTLLIDTYDVESGVKKAIEIAGPELGAVRIDSGELPTVVKQVRNQLDSLGAKRTKIIVTNDLDEFSIAKLRNKPVDAYGVGTSVVTGSGAPTMGLVYKLVARNSSAGKLEPVAKRSPQKESMGGRKEAYRLMKNGTATEERISSNGSIEELAESRFLITNFLQEGRRLTEAAEAKVLDFARQRHKLSISELPKSGLNLEAGEPAIKTTIF